MAIGPGSRLGSYEVLSSIGVGGMGEVYKARDSKLGRDVALKIVRSSLSADPEHLTRLRREAHILASLNHPHIATVHDLGDVDGVTFLIMELVPGETLLERLRMGRLPVPEALRICSQVAAALEAAHERGVIHRDLKPGNIKITPDGVVKVLDFGLAKAADAAQLASDSSRTPTAFVSEVGVIGTVPYMSPEQARGKPVDRRADIWSFGCVLFETLTGQRPFTGETGSDIVAGILERDVDWQLLPPAVPPDIERLLRRCLQKDPARRVRDIGDARLEAEEALSALGAPSAARARSFDRHGTFKTVTAALTGLVLGAASGALLGPKVLPQPSTSIETAAHFTVPLPQGTRLANTDFPAVVISPDGSLIAYVGTRGGRAQLFIRALNALDATPVPGSTDALAPFFSPDSRWIGFFAGGKLKKVSVAGGAPMTVTDAPIGFGGAWGTGDTIVFAAASGSGLSQVPAAGGATTRLTTLDAQKGEFSHRWPAMLPDGKTVLFTVGTVGSWDDAQIVAQSIGSGEKTVLVQGGTHPHYLPTGHLLYARAGALMAVPFDAARMQVRGTPVRLVDNVAQSFDGAVQASVSSSGSLVYVEGNLTSAERRLVAVDRSGAAQPLAAPARTFSTPRVSPDGRKIAVVLAGGTDELWIFDLTQASLSQLTFDSSVSSPIWTPDSERVTFSSNRSGPPNLFWIRVLNGTEERLASSENLQTPGSWSPDGKTLAFVQHHPTTGRDIWLLATAGGRTSRPFLASPFDESWPRFAPDGRLIAYVSNESGRNEVYVRPSGESSRKWQVSREGGAEPVWAPGGRELFFRSGDRMFAASVDSSRDVRISDPRSLFEGKFDKGTIDAANYDVANDPLRFVMVKAVERESEQNQMHVALSWAKPAMAAAFPGR